MKISWLISVSFSAGLALLPFSVVYRPIELGYLAASPGVLILTAPLILHAMLICIGRGSWGFMAKESVVLIFAGITLSLFSMFFFGYERFFAVKMVTLSVLTIYWFSPLILSGYLRESHLKTGVFIGLIISFIGLLFDFYPKILPSGVDSYIFSKDYISNKSGRPRGFTAEASQFSAMLIRMVLLLFLLKVSVAKTKLRSIHNLFLLLIFIPIFTQSKGAFLSLLLAYTFALFINGRLVTLIFGGSIFMVFLLPYFLQVLTYDLENFSSISTRALLVGTGLWSLIYSPVGYGFYGFYPSVSHFGQELIPITQTYLVFFEEAEEIFTDMVALSTKSTLLDLMIVFGIFFMAFIFKLTRSVAPRSLVDRFALALFLCTGLYTSGHDSILMFTGLLVLAARNFSQSRNGSITSHWQSRAGQ